jgi:hypothetical protein
MGAIEVVVLGAMLLGWLGVVAAAMVPAIVLDTRHSTQHLKVDLESRAFGSARMHR